MYFLEAATPKAHPNNQKPDFLVSLEITNFMKIGFLGYVRGGFGGCYIQKIHRGIDPDDILNFRKIDFLKIQYFGIFRHPSYISAYSDITIGCALKTL